MSPNEVRRALRGVPMRRLLPSLALACAIPALLAACGGSSGGGSASAATGAYRSGSSAKVTTGRLTVTTARSPLGTMLVDGTHRTLYLFDADKTDRSSCNGACATVWPPATTSGTPLAAGGAAARLLGVTRRSGGGTQVTYDGHPLYYYAGDQKPAQATGQGLDQFGAEWYVVAPSGRQIDQGS